VQTTPVGSVFVGVFKSQAVLSGWRTCLRLRFSN